MKLIEAVLRWNLKGGVVVTRNEPCEFSKSHHKTLWACESCWEKMTDDERIKLMYIDAWTAVIRDGVNPQDMHKALLVIQEYRKTLSPEIEGAE